MKREIKLKSGTFYHGDLIRVKWTSQIEPGPTLYIVLPPHDGIYLSSKEMFFMDIKGGTRFYLNGANASNDGIEIFLVAR